MTDKKQPLKRKTIGKEALKLETKSQKFERIAEIRIKKVLHSMRLLGNCGNRNNYDYTSEQVEKMKGAIIQAYEQLISKFTKQEKQAINDFKF